MRGAAPRTTHQGRGLRTPRLSGPLWQGGPTGQLVGGKSLGPAVQLGCPRLYTPGTERQGPERRRHLFHRQISSHGTSTPGRPMVPEWAAPRPCLPLVSHGCVPLSPGDCPTPPWVLPHRKQADHAFLPAAQGCLAAVSARAGPCLCSSLVQPARGPGGAPASLAWGRIPWGQLRAIPGPWQVSEQCARAHTIPKPGWCSPAGDAARTPHRWQELPFTSRRGFTKITGPPPPAPPLCHRGQPAGSRTGTGLGEGRCYPGKGTGSPRTWPVGTERWALLAAGGPPAGRRLTGKDRGDPSPNPSLPLAPTGPVS